MASVGAGRRTLPELRRDLDRRTAAVRASTRAADDVLGLRSDEILACFEEALGDRLPEMGTDAAAGREANAELREGVEDVECGAL